MSTHTDTASPSVMEARNHFTDLPSTYNGWVRYDRDRDNEVFSYWVVEPAGYTPQYICVTATYMKNSRSSLGPEIRVSKVRSDGFGHHQRSYVLCERSADKFTQLWDTAASYMDERMERHTGSEAEAFEQPPGVPSTIGDWELVNDSTDVTEWSRGLGRAEITLEQDGWRSRYKTDKRRYTIKYWDIDTGDITVASDVSQTFAFEIALHTLRNLPDPICDMDTQRSALKEITGIGPAKTEKLLALGVTTPEAVATHIEAENSIVNAPHAEATDKIITSSIRDDVLTAREVNCR